MPPNLYTHQDSNIAKTWVLMAVFFSVVIAVGYGAAWYFGSTGILWGAVIFALVMNIWSYWNSDKVALAMSRATPADEREYRDLHNIIENLAITAGLPKPRVFIIADPAPNAFATGRNPKHAAVAVTTGLLAALDRTELEGVLAHELSHIGNRDILVSTIAVVLVGFVAILSDMFMRISLFGGRSSDSRGNNPLVAVIAIATIVLAPLAATLLQLAVSRRREFLADSSGALLTRYPDGLAAALQKISAYKAPMRHASNATAHLFIANPFGASGKKSSLTKLFSTHPPVEERIAALTGMRQ